MGADVVKQLRAGGREIRAADINVGKVRGRFGSSVETVRLDFTDPATFEATLKGVEKMFLLRPSLIWGT